MKKWILISPVVLLLAACGSGSESESGSEKDFADQLLGKWEQPCTVSNGNQGRQMFLEFYAQDVTISQTVYSDTSCEFPYIDSAQDGSYTVSSSPDNTFYFIDFRTKVTYLGFYEDFFIAVLNSDQVCGYDDWAVGVKRDVTNCQGEISYSFAGDLIMPVILEGGRLYITDGSSTPSSTYFDKVE